MHVVTIDFARARKQVSNGSHTVTALKAHAHARERRTDMRADGTLVIGWLASQTDMLATDWEIVA